MNLENEIDTVKYISKKWIYFFVKFRNFGKSVYLESGKSSEISGKDKFKEINDVLNKECFE